VISTLRSLPQSAVDPDFTYPSRFPPLSPPLSTFYPNRLLGSSQFLPTDPFFWSAVSLRHHFLSLRTSHCLSSSRSLQSEEIPLDRCWRFLVFAPCLPPSPFATPPKTCGICTFPETPDSALFSSFCFFGFSTARPPFWGGFVRKRLIQPRSPFTKRRFLLKFLSPFFLPPFFLFESSLSPNCGFSPSLHVASCRLTTQAGIAGYTGPPSIRRTFLSICSFRLPGLFFRSALP